MKYENEIAEGMKFYEAEKKAEAKIGLLIHLVVAIFVGVLLTAINLYTQTGYLWFKWPVLGLSLGVVFHGLAIFFESGSIRKRLLSTEIRRLGSSG
jgi:preprotein translocase subunit Sec61beta